MNYPALFTPGDNGRFIVSFRDIPEAIAQGDDEADALAEAKSGLLAAMDFYFEDRRPVPPPSPALPGERMIALPASAAAKIFLLNEMLAQKVGASELARRLGTTPSVVTRLLDLNHTTKIDTLEGALAALGCGLELSVTRASPR